MIYPAYDPYRAGLCDALFGRPCESPWKACGFKAIRRNAQYVQGYMRGEELRNK